MSTKVYELYHFSGSLEALHAYLTRLRAAYLAELREQFERVRAMSGYRVVVGSIEAACDRNDLSTFNIRASACLYPLNGELYVQFFALPERLYEDEVGKSLTDRSYWDNSDRPAEVSESEWQLRRQLCRQIFGAEEWPPPSRAGFVWIFADKHDAFDLVYDPAKKRNKEKET